MDYENILKFSFAWLFSKESIKYSLLYYAVAALLSIVFYAVLISLFLQFFGALISQFLADPTQFFLGFLTNTQATSQLMSSFWSFVFLLIPFLLVFGVISLIAHTYLGALFQLFGLREAKLPNITLSFISVLKLILLGIASFFVAFLSWYNKIFLLMLLFAIVTFFLGFLAWPFFIISILLFLVYFVVFIYNAIRISFCVPIFLSQETGIMDSIKESWDLTQDRVWEIILARIICIIVFFIGILVVSLILNVLFSFIALAFVPTDLWGLSSYLSIVPTSGLETELVGLSLVEYFRAQIASYISDFITNFLLAPISLLFTVFLTAGIYSQLLQGKIKTRASSGQSFVGTMRAR